MIPTRKQVLALNRDVRQGTAPRPRRLEEGYVSMRIPTRDYKLLKRYDPELFHPDHEVRLRAWKRLEAGPLGDVYRVTERSPLEVRRAARHGNRGIIVR